MRRRTISTYPSFKPSYDLVSVTSCDQSDQLWPGMTNVTSCDQLWPMWTVVTNVTRCDQCDQLWPVVTNVTQSDQMWPMWPAVINSDQLWPVLSRCGQCDQLWPMWPEVTRCDQVWSGFTNSNIYHLLWKPPTNKNQLRRQSTMWVYHLVWYQMSLNFQRLYLKLSLIFLEIHHISISCIIHVSFYHRCIVNINLHNLCHPWHRAIIFMKTFYVMFTAHHVMEEMKLNCPYFVRYWYQHALKFSGNLDTCPCRPVLIDHTECDGKCDKFRSGCSRRRRSCGFRGTTPLPTPPRCEREGRGAGGSASLPGPCNRSANLHCLPLLSPLSLTAGSTAWYLWIVTWVCIWSAAFGNGKCDKFRSGRSRRRRSCGFRGTTPPPTPPRCEREGRGAGGSTSVPGPCNRSANLHCAHTRVGSIPKELGIGSLCIFHCFQKEWQLFNRFPAENRFPGRNDSLMRIDSHGEIYSDRQKIVIHWAKNTNFTQPITFLYIPVNFSLGNQFLEGKEWIPCEVTKIPKKNRFPTLGTGNRPSPSTNIVGLQIWFALSSLTFWICLPSICKPKTRARIRTGLSCRRRRCPSRRRTTRPPRAWGGTVSRGAEHDSGCHSTSHSHLLLEMLRFWAGPGFGSGSGWWFMSPLI